MAGTQGAVCASVAHRFSSLGCTRCPIFGFNGCDGVRCKKENGLKKPYLQFIHNLWVTSMQLYQPPGFHPTKKTPRAPHLEWDFRNVSGPQGSTLLPRCSQQQPPNQVPCTWSTGSVATVQWRVPSAAPFLCRSVSFLVFWLQEDWDRKVHKQEDEDVFLMGDSMLRQGTPMIPTGLGEHSGPNSAGR